MARTARRPDPPRIRDTMASFSKPPVHPGLARLPATLVPGVPPTALAPMQDVTTRPFMHLVARTGAPDWFVTEFFRIHGTARLDAHILDSIDRNDTGRPIFAQLIGESIPDLVRAARELARHPVAGIDLNLGCPAPKVYKKNVGGGLLRDPEKIRAILMALREACPDGLPLTAKMRLGFDDDLDFERLLGVIAGCGVDLLSVHGRTVRQLYRGEVAYGRIGDAVRFMPCPVLANGNVTSAAKAEAVLATTGAAGLMIGRHAIRNPWIFRQVRARLSGGEPFRPRLRDVRRYVDDLFEATSGDAGAEKPHVDYMKKFLNFIGQGVDPRGAFLSDMRRAQGYAGLRRVCDEHLLAGDRGDLFFSDEPFEGVVARPNCED